MNSFKCVRLFQIKLEVLVFEEMGKPEYPEKKKDLITKYQCALVSSFVNILVYF